MPRGQPVLDRLVALLDLERIEDNIFRGVSPTESGVRVFGGQVAGQALIAAGRTVPVERRVHSLHAYFIRPGDPRVPIVYNVDRIRDGRSFTTRRVVAIQHGEAIFALAASFQLAEVGLEHADEMPEVPPPEQLDDWASWARRSGDSAASVTRVPRPFDLRFITPPIWADRVRRRTGSPVRDQLWMRADGVLPDDALLHICVLAYASDLTLLWSVGAAHGHVLGQDVMAASLDHAMWFHRPFRADDWVLCDYTSPSASGARGLATGRFFSRDGTLIANVVQEGLLRLLR
ncbi:MAG TPA: acyl-CoA thioesterase II [Pseudonocardiaceae bacterium]|nr:acyl-CoA thioesterase II [Pseudonocardiaceae bacterium]